MIHLNSKPEIRVSSKKSQMFHVYTEFLKKIPMLILFTVSERYKRDRPASKFIKSTKVP